MKVTLYPTSNPDMRTLKSGATVLSCLFLLSGCGGDSNSEPAAQKSQAASQDPKGTAAPTADPSGSVPPHGATTDVVPGEVIVKFRSSGAARVTECAARVLGQRRSFRAATADGSDSLDRLTDAHGLSSGQPLLRGRTGLTTESARVKFRGRRAPGARSGANLEELINVYRLRFDSGEDAERVASDLAQDPHVEYAHPNYRMEASYTPNDPFLGSSGSWGQTEADLWGLHQMGAPVAWDVARGAGVVVAVLDTGIDATHPDIAENVWTNPNEVPNNGIDDDANGYVDDTNGWNFVSGTPSPVDGNGHGTHVSGTIAAQDNNGLGIVGVAPDAKIMALKGLDDGGGGNLFDLASGIAYAAANGAKVINNSWGCTQSCPAVPVVDDAVKSAHAAGTVVVFAAGNTADDVREFAPNNGTEALVVGASTPGGQLASFSNFGFVDVVAPGAGNPEGVGIQEPARGILSLRAANTFPPAHMIVSEQYLRHAGTSMAAPHVAGLAALIRSAHPEYTPEQVRQAIRHSSADLGEGGFDTTYGYGLAQAAGALFEPAPLEARLDLPRVVGSNEPLDVRGWIGGPGFQSYEIHYGLGATPATWTHFASGTSAGSPGSFGEFDVTGLPDGDVTLRLIAHTSDGRSYEDRRIIEIDRVDITAPTVLSYLGTDTVEVFGSVGIPNLESFTVRIETLYESTDLGSGNVTLTGGGTSPVTNGLLAVWNTANVPADHYRIVLEATNTNGEVASESVAVVVDTKLHEGFPVYLSGGYPSSEDSPLVDVDGDGKDDHVVAYGNLVHVFRDDGTEAPGYPRDVVVPVFDSIAAGDIDGDGATELVVSPLDGSLWVFGSDGSTFPGFPLHPGSRADVGLADIDGDGDDEIVRADWSGHVDVIRADGNQVPGFPVATSGGGPSGGAALGDLDGDGDTEIVVALSQGGPYVLVAYDGAGNVLPGFPVQVATSSNLHQAPSVGDLDRDGDLEIVVTNASSSDASAGLVTAYHHNGQVVSGWPFEIDALYASTPVLADLDGDGSLEVFAGLATPDQVGRMQVLTASGALVPGWPIFTDDSLISTLFPIGPPVVVDFDGDGLSEVLVVRSHGRYTDETGSLSGKYLSAYEHDGTPLDDLSRPTYGFLRFGADSAPSVGDLDGDGQLELVWVEDRSFWRGEVLAHAWDLDTPTSAEAGWTTLRGDARRTQSARPVETVQTPITLTQKGASLLVNGVGLYRIRTSHGGVIQFHHPWQANVRYSINGGALTNTPFGWGGPVQLTPHTEYVVRIETPGPVTIQIDWW